MMTGYEELANAIILRAVEDYRLALNANRKDPEKKCGRKKIRDIERFFRSRWFGILTGLDPELLITQLKKEAGK